MYRFKSSHTRRAGFRLAIFLVALSFLAGFFHIKGVVADATAIQPMGAEFEAKVSDSEPEYTCTDLSLYDGNTCHFVLQYCDDLAAQINYLKYYYCLPTYYRLVIIALMVIFLSYIFILLGSTADKWFCPALERVSDLLRLPPEVAGVTFLSFGNGAPDIFSIIASVGSASSIAFGEVLGAGNFIVLFIMGVVSMVTKPKLQAIPFLRDAGTYAICVTLFAGLLLWGAAYWWTGFIMITAYIIYVLVVISNTVIRWIRARGRPEPLARRHRQLLEASVHLPVSVGENLVDQYQQSLLEPVRLEDMEAEDEAVLVQYREARRLPPHHPHNREGRAVIRWVRYCLGSFAWKEKSLLEKVVYIIEAPLTLARNMSVPPATVDMYHPLLVSCVPWAAPLLLVWGQGWLSIPIPFIPFHFPILLIPIILLMPLTPLLIYPASRHQPGEIALGLFSLGGFVTAVLWMQVVANELVAILQSLGVILHIPESVLGLTILAWGNSVGDMVSDVSVARNGFPEMAVAAIFAAPVMNLLVGIGISFIGQTLTTGHKMVFETDAHAVIAVGTLMLALYLHLIVISACRFKSPRWWGAVTCTIYVVFIIVQLVAEVVMRLA